MSLKFISLACFIDIERCAQLISVMWSVVMRDGVVRVGGLHRADSSCSGVQSFSLSGNPLVCEIIRTLQVILVVNYVYFVVK